MKFKEAKVVIRGALAEATPEKLIEVLEAARAGEMPVSEAIQAELDRREEDAGQWRGLQ